MRLCQQVAQMLVDAKCDDVRTYDVRELCQFTDYFVVSTARSCQHVFSAASAVVFQVCFLGMLGTLLQMIMTCHLNNYGNSSNLVEALICLLWIDRLLFNMQALLRYFVCLKALSAADMDLPMSYQACFLLVSASCAVMPLAYGIGLSQKGKKGLTGLQ